MLATVAVFMLKITSLKLLKTEPLTRNYPNEICLNVDLK